MKFEENEKVQFQHPKTNEWCKGIVVGEVSGKINQYVVQIAKRIDGYRIFLVKAKDLISTPF